LNSQATTPPSVGLEICVDSASGFFAAAENGADRIELCAALSEGGLTPSLGMMELAKGSSTPVRAMIRPRGGDFIYRPAELRVMRRDIEQAASCHLEGVVLGCNRESGELDETALATLVEHARTFGLKVTLHRSFDLVPDPRRALGIAMALRIDTILTSGLQATAAKGIAVIADLVRDARSSADGFATEIMAGAGITPSNVEQLVRETGVGFVHSSSSRARGNTNGSGDRLALYATAQRETDPLLIAQLRRAIDRRSGRLRSA
jgi:copper homeostasis protein